MCTCVCALCVCGGGGGEGRKRWYWCAGGPCECHQCRAAECLHRLCMNTGWCACLSEKLRKHQSWEGFCPLHQWQSLVLRQT